MDDYFKPFKKCTKWFCKYKKEVEPFPHSHIPYSKENKSCSECGGKLRHEYCCWGRIFREKAISIYDQFKCVQCEARTIISSKLTMEEKSEVSLLGSFTKKSGTREVLRRYAIPFCEDERCEIHRKIEPYDHGHVPFFDIVLCPLCKKAASYLYSQFNFGTFFSTLNVFDVYVCHSCDRDNEFYKVKHFDLRGKNMKNSIQKQGKKMVKAVKKLAKDVEMHEDAEKGMYKKMNAKKKDKKGRNTCGK